VYGPAQRRRPEHPRPMRPRLPRSTAHGPRPTANPQLLPLGPHPDPSHQRRVPPRTKGVHREPPGILPSLQTHTSYVNTPDASDIVATMARFQYQRYRSRGDRLHRGTHHLNYSYNSSNTTNMTPGDPYRYWFHRTISCSYYSLGEATTQYEQ
jgi:hypothetical protein